MNNIPPLNLTEAQKSNPVHLSMLNVVDSMRDGIPGAAKWILGMLDMCQVPDPSTNNVVDLHNATGASVFEQLISMVTYLQEKSSHSGKFKFSTESMKKAGFNEWAIASILQLGETYDGIEGHTSSKWLDIADSLVPVPYPHCRYSRLANKAVEYLLSLGRPKTCLVHAYMEELDMLARESPRGVYEEILYFNLNGKPTAAYVTVRDGQWIALRYVKNRQSGDFSYYRTCGPFEDSSSSFSADFSEELPFDMRSFLVNLWAAKAANTFEDAMEPTENRTDMQALVGPAKANFSTYNYVRITPEGEKDYDESREVISAARGDVEYRKSVWFSRAYYAQRGKEKKVVLCKASIHHRKCAEVTGEEKPTMYT